MKTKVYWLTLLASAVMMTQTQAHGFGGGGASFGGAHFSGGHAAIGHAPTAPAYHAAPARTFAPNRATYANRYPTYNRGKFANQSARNHVAYSYSRRSGVTNVDGAHNLPGNWRNHVFARHSANWHRDWDHNRVYWWNGHRCRFVNGSWAIFDVGFDPWWSWPCPEYYYGYPCDDGDYDY
jgi:hypothetical protein